MSLQLWELERAFKSRLACREPSYSDWAERKMRYAGQDAHSLLNAFRSMGENSWFGAYMFVEKRIIYSLLGSLSSDSYHGSQVYKYNHACVNQHGYLFKCFWFRRMKRLSHSLCVCDLFEDRWRNEFIIKSLPASILQEQKCSQTVLNVQASNLRAQFYLYQIVIISPLHTRNEHVEKGKNSMIEY